MLTFSELQSINVARCAKWHTGRPWSIAEWTNALAGEAGEVANIAKKILRYECGMIGNVKAPTKESADELRVMLARELADVVLYASLIADQLHVDLGEVIIGVFNDKSDQLGFPERLASDP
jgi:NTP pyrophosphatase (non-canonical NTP hydrolase)